MNLEERMEQHEKTDRDNFYQINKKLDDMWRVVFGNEDTKEKGMKDQVTEMYELLISRRKVIGFFSSVGVGMRTILFLIGFIVAMKTLGISIISWFIDILNK